MSLLNKFCFGGYVRRLVEFSQQRYEKGDETMYVVLLLGIEKVKISFAPGDPHDYKLVIDTIHKYKRRNPQLRIGEGYSAAIETLISSVDAIRAINIVLDLINYDVEKQERQTAAFRPNYKKWIEKLDEIIAIKREKLSAGMEDFFNHWYTVNITGIKERVDRIM